MTNHRGLDTDIGWQRREFRKLWKALRESNAAKRLQASTIGEGGLTVKDGGRVTGLFPSGRVSFEFGQISAEAAGQPGDGTFGFRVMTDQDPDGITTKALFEIFESASVGRVTRFFNADIWTAAATTGAALAAGDNSVTILDGTGVLITHTTTANAANCFIASSNGQIFRSTSSLRYKQDVEDAQIDPADVLKLQPKTWRDKAEVEADPDTETRYVGLIAEDLHELPTMRQFVVYDDEGKPDAIAEPRLVVALLEVIKDQERRISALESADERAAEAEEREDPSGSGEGE